MEYLLCYAAGLATPFVLAFICELIRYIWYKIYDCPVWFHMWPAHQLTETDVQIARISYPYVVFHQKGRLVWAKNPTKKYWEFVLVKDM